MIGETIQRIRKERHMSQEELAVKLHVVRQTVSKWENNLSVPDADVLIHMAEVLEVPVSRLLGVETEEQNVSDLAEELARLNQQLAEQKQEERRRHQVEKKRGFILFLSFAALLIALLAGEALVSVVLVGLCMLAAAMILYRNLALLTENAKPSQMKALKGMTVFNLVIMALCVSAVVVSEVFHVQLSQEQGKILALAIVSGIMLACGYFSPKLPFSRHTGLRLPWTVRDEDTWNLAHRVLGYLSLPTVLLYWALAFTVPDFETVSIAMMVLWIGVPGLLSGIFFWKKMRGRM